jgi:hypothetical protein
MPDLKRLGYRGSLALSALVVGLLACDTGLDPTPSDGSPPGLAVEEPFPIDRGDEGVSTPGKYKGLWLRLVDNGAPTVSADDDRIGVVCIGMTDPATECGDFIARINSHWIGEVSDDVVVMSCGRPGAGIEDWINPENDWNLWGACLNVLLPYLGVGRDQVRVVYHTAANRSTTREDGSPLPTYPHPESNYEALQGNLDAFAARLTSFFPNVQAVYTSSRGYGGFGRVSGGGEPSSYEEGHAVNSWLSRNPLVDGVWYGWGAYLWAPPCPTDVLNGGGICYSVTDFDEGGLQALPSGRGKVSWLIHHRLLLEDWYRRR